MTLWTTARQASLSITSSGVCSNMSIESVMPSNYLILCRPLLLYTLMYDICLSQRQNRKTSTGFFFLN